MQQTLLSEAQLNKIIANNIEEVFAHFNYYPIRRPKRFDGPCPIHEGDKYNAFNLYMDGHSKIGNWRCNTQGCHYVFESEPIGLIRGLLSKQNNWRGFSDKEHIVSKSEAIRFYCETFKIDSEIEYTNTNRTQRFNPNIKNRYDELESIGNVDILYSRLKPPYYFINRGFSRDTLAKFYVGRCETYGKPMYMREILPVLNLDGTEVIGVSGRSINEQCKHCGCHHSKHKPCPPVDKQQAYCKWKHSSTSLTHVLYNVWNAKNYLAEKNYSVLIVEGPTNVWRLSEAGINNCVATFGNHITYEQTLLLDQLGVKELIVIFDNDPAGENGRSQVDFIANGRYTIKHTRIPQRFNDIAEMSIEEAREILKELI